MADTKTAHLPLALVLAGSTAAADPITSRDYAIELHEGIALGDATLIGMGGAGAARIVGSAGAMLNPSAPVIRRATDNARWSWDYHLDVLTGRFSSDYDNNGSVTTDGGAVMGTAGVSVRIGAWAVAWSGVVQSTPVGGSESGLVATMARIKFAIAYWFDRADLALGVAGQTVRFAIADDDELFAIRGAGAVVGTTWLPRNERFRVGVALESRILSGEIETQSCNPEDCQGYILPSEVESPGRTIVGLAYRWAASPWNQQVATRFRDERSLTVAADLVVSGSSSNGNGLEAFGKMELQPVGRSYAASPRIGAEAEAIPGRLRLRAGTYWEPGRFEGIGGRIHGTVGFELRALEFRLRRGRLGATFDGASRYRNLGLSIGFWH